jgi:PAS domain S-box-containing protein
MVFVGMIRVLYIDDEYLLLDLVKDSLSIPDELAVETAISPQEGLAMLRQGEYDAIISDYQIPQMTGIQLLARVRSEGCDLPFILFTGRGREEVVIEAYRLGADGYVQKGGDAASQFTELDKVLRQAVSKYRAVKDFAASEEKFRGIFDSAGDAFFINSLDGGFLEVNKAACAFLGKEKGELLGLTLDDIHSDELRATRQHWDWLVPGAAPMVVEIEHSSQDGGSIPAEISISRIEIGGRPVILSIARDISARRAVECSLAESERQLAALMSNLPGMAYRCRNDKDWTMEFVSDGCLQLTGYRPEQLVNNRDLSFADMILPEDQEVVWKGVQDGVQAEGPYRLTYRIRTANGKVRWVLEQGRREPSPRHEHGVLEGLIVDISERMEALEDLRTSRLRLALTLDMARVVYWEFDAERDRFVFDDQFYALYGTDMAHEGGAMSPEEYKVRFVLPEDREKVALILDSRRELIANETKISSEHRIVRRDGAVRHILVRTMLIREGARVRISGANQDITELKMAEEGVRMANAKLNLLSSVTRHDISNQLMAMEGNLKLMRKRGLDPFLADRLEKLQHSVSIINHQINFTKEYQEMGSVAPSWQEVRTAILGLPEASEVSSLRISPQVEKLSVFADPMLPKVFRNLLENSTKYAYKPTTVRVDCRREGAELVLIYEDDGPGVAPAEKELIFEKGHGQGTGLGLFLSREILAITGVRIIENGERGNGARFEMRVPAQCHRFED